MIKSIFYLKLAFGLLLGLIVSDISSVGLRAQPHYSDAVPNNKQDSKLYLVKEYELEDEGALNIFTIAGNIDVVSIPDSKKVRIELYVKREFSFWPFSESLENYRITNLKRGNEIISSVELKSKHKSSFWSCQTTFSYKIEVPRNISTSLKTRSGSLSVQNVYGEQHLNSHAGNISATDIKGILKAYTSGGNININDSKGIVYARADGGNITIDNMEGELRVKIHGGRISSSGISGSMIAQVNAGDINAQFTHVGKGIDLQTNAGNIHLIVPESTGYGLYARATSIRFDEPGSFQGSYSTRLADGTINGGGIPVNVTANSGTVTILLKK